MRKDDGFSEKAVEVDVSASDQALPLGSRAIYVGGAGDLAVTMWGGGDITFTGMAAGSYLPIRARTILSTGTTATDIVALL